MQKKISNKQNLTVEILNTVEAESDESQTYYDENDLSSDEGCRYTDTDDNPDESDKKEQVILPNK